jgi:hypothetical protein
MVYGERSAMCWSAIQPAVIFSFSQIRVDTERHSTYKSRSFIIVEAVVGTIAGAALYKEAESTAASPAAPAARQATR